MRALAFVLLVAGCGGATKAPGPVTAPGAGSGSAAASTPPVAKPAITPERVCKRIVELSTQRCASFATMNVDEASCLRELQQTADDPALEVFQECVLQTSCEEVTNCLMASQDAVDARLKANPRTCDDHAHFTRVVGVPAADWAKRNGAGVTKLADVRSTKDLPVEMCTVKGANDWLLTLTCNDGSRPLANPEDARTGNVGQGGRCRAVIDRYVVPCPEKRYEIFIDAYACPKQ